VEGGRSKSILWHSGRIGKNRPLTYFAHLSTRPLPPRFLAAPAPPPAALAGSGAAWDRRRWWGLPGDVGDSSSVYGVGRGGADAGASSRGVTGNINCIPDFVHV